MEKNEFIRQFAEIYVGKSLPHSAEAYDHMGFEVSFAVDEKEQRIVILSGDDFFPIVMEIPKRDHFLLSGFADIKIREKKLKFSNKRTKFIKLIYKYLKDNEFIELDGLGNIEILEKI